MLLQLRNIYNILYKKGYNGGPFFCTKRKTTPYCSPAEDICVNYKESDEGLTMKNQILFLELHFQPVYDIIKADIISDTIGEPNNNLLNLMGRKSCIK